MKKAESLFRAIERLKMFRAAAYGAKYGYPHGNLSGIAWPGPQQLDLIIEAASKALEGVDTSKIEKPKLGY